MTDTRKFSSMLEILEMTGSLAQAKSSHKLKHNQIIKQYRKNSLQYPGVLHNLMRENWLHVECNYELGGKLCEKRSNDDATGPFEEIRKRSR